MRRRLLLAAATVLMATASAPMGARAQQAPPFTRPVLLMGGFPAGTQADIYWRLIQEPLSRALGVPVAVEARTGASGNIAMEATARATPDGTTVLAATSAMLAINRAVMPSMPIDTQADLAPVMTLFEVPNVLVTSTERRPGYTDCRALIAAARARPGQLNYASSGIGASTHLAAAQFATAAGLNMVHVPYRGGPFAMTALYQGDADLFFYQSGPVLDDWRAGKVRLLGITSAQRVATLPEIPTIAEACDMPGFVSTTWYGVVVAARTPPAVIDRLYREIRALTDTPEMRTRIEGMGFTMTLGGPEDMRARLAADIPHWAAVVERSGARAQ
ncbi:Bug family tripartite tricarboxylate transporter substrate binding protein [Rhodovarius lipocyclicus]|uniref:Bug family tripartite tricarboxylate transporter substrate binding protein n=1 Tax=Rhodovarius lipocyclicus TaxID=268410 RepID=UPI001358E4FC|nr:tripartite tricarboxylate transporter substrate-binding protein [Rhodovarius lipocyclicus]